MKDIDDLYRLKINDEVLQGIFTWQTVVIDEGIKDYLLSEEKVDEYINLLYIETEKVLMDMAEYSWKKVPCNCNLDDWFPHALQGMNLSEALEKRLVTCFHRSILYQLMVQQLQPYAIGAIMEGEVREGEFCEGHAYNIVFIPQTKKRFLVDTAFLNNGQPIVADYSCVEKLGEYEQITIILKDGKKRKYSGYILEYLKDPEKTKKHFESLLI
ncbi:MAG: hypothetical protein QXD48_00770 [Candidatus Aenigmatarchaeota archaeon]